MVQPGEQFQTSRTYTHEDIIQFGERRAISENTIPSWVTGAGEWFMAFSQRV
ncbi:hypothetical protein QUF51_01330 [Bacillus pumilus]|nr:hypothetical protein [Bacillus pumilus]OLP65762.1 hypothetical protein BACPU_13800 [Bacillus pumilus]